jgi:hypothetical protein
MTANLSSDGPNRLHRSVRGSFAASRLDFPRGVEGERADPRLQRAHPDTGEDPCRGPTAGHPCHSWRSRSGRTDGGRDCPCFHSRSGCPGAIRFLGVYRGVNLWSCRLAQGARATTHWGAFHLLEYFGAIPVNKRVVVDGKLVNAAGVTAGIDGALTVASLLRGDQVAQEIQLGIEYAPEPPFHSGTPASAPPEMLRAVENRISGLTMKRLSRARRVASKLGLHVETGAGTRE